MHRRIDFRKGQFLLFHLALPAGMPTRLREYTAPKLPIERAADTTEPGVPIPRHESLRSLFGTKPFRTTNRTASADCPRPLQSHADG